MTKTHNRGPALSSYEPVELLKINIDYVKHLTTLSTGAIILQVAFLEKVFPHPKWKAFTVASLLSFALSIVAAVVTYTIFVAGSSSTRPELQGPAAMNIGGYGMILTWFGFLLGVVALIVFSIRNLLTLS